jgi:hypothetical protein
MKAIFKFSIWTIAAFILLALITLIYINFSPVPTYPKPKIKELAVEATSERILQGKKMASMLCIVCHLGSDNTLSGKFLQEVPTTFGKIYSKNITSDKEYGIGNWTDGELYYFLRTGLRKDGSYAPTYMPKFPNMADEDLLSIIAWLRSDDEKLKPSQKVPSMTQLSLFSKFLLKVVFSPFPLPKQTILRPDTADQVKSGEYLANSVYSCYGCHSVDFAKQDDINPSKSAGYYGGGNPVLNQDGEPVLSANLTMDKETGIGNYTENEFVIAVKTGRKRDGTMTRDPMFPHSLLTDQEVKSIFAFLKTVPVINNKVK